MAAIQIAFVISVLAVVLQLSIGQEPSVAPSYGQAKNRLSNQKSGTGNKETEQVKNNISSLLNSQE